MIGQVTHVTIYVSDQSAAREFYTGKLGFDIVADMGFGDMHWLTVRPKAGGPEIALWPGSAERGDRIGGFGGIVMHCDDVDATYEELKGKGVEFPTPPEDVPWGRHAMLADQDGNQINVVQPKQFGG